MILCCPSSDGVDCSGVLGLTVVDIIASLVQQDVLVAG